MSQMTIALIILVATVVLFIWEPWPIIVTAIGASIVFAYAHCCHSGRTGDCRN